VGTVRRATLENGLRVVAVEMPHVSYVSVRLVVGAGSRDDAREKAGISHFVEHVIFRGTERHPHESALRAHLASLGIRMNAHTSKETTCLDIDVPKENVVAGLRFLSEVLTSPTFNGFEVERRIVMEEMNNAYDEIDGSLWPIDLFADARMWPYHALGIPCIGEPRTVLNVTLDDVKQYLASHYRAGGMALGIAGGVELSAILPDVERLFGILPAGQPERTRRAPPLLNGSMHWLDQPYSPRARVRVIFPFEVKSPRDHVTAFVLHAHLCTEGAGRIHDALRSRTGVAYTGDSELEIYSDCARFSIFSEVKKENMPQMVGAVARSLRDLQKHGLTDDELAAAKLILLRDVRATNDVAENAASHYAYATVREQPGPNEMIEIVPTITTADVIALARTAFRTKNAFVVVAGPRDIDDQRTAWQLFETSLGG
jgi:predicted Zn-dependent peptidase